MTAERATSAALTAGRPTGGTAAPPPPLAGATPDPWTELRAHTAARIALGRSGVSLPTAELLRFGVAHAQARDAVHQPFDAAALRAELQGQGFETVEVESAAAAGAQAYAGSGDAAAARATYLRRPDLGRRLSERSRALLAALHPRRDAASADAQAARSGNDDIAAGGCDLLCVVGDGLSATAVHRHAAALLLELRPRLEADGLTLGPIVLAHGARVALGDEVSAAFGAAAVLVLIGERPGLSSPDSLGAYLTWAPRVGCRDADRNCVSNIRPQGLPPADAARKLAWLVGAARRLGATGLALKDASAADRLPPPAAVSPAALPGEPGG